MYGIKNNIPRSKGALIDKNKDMYTIQVAEPF
jgi:hypothetical protein